MKTTTTNQPTTALDSRFRCPDPQEPKKRLQRPMGCVLGVLWRQYRIWKLKREGQQLMDSFLRVAQQLGHSPNCQQHPRFQIAKLERINKIAAELRMLSFPHLADNSSRPCGSLEVQP